MIEFEDVTPVTDTERRTIKYITPQVKKKTAKINALVSDMDFYVDAGDFKAVQEAEYALLKETMLLTNYVRSVVIERGDHNIVDKAFASIVKAVVKEKQDGVIHIVFNKLLPKRVKNGELRDLTMELNTFSKALDNAFNQCSLPEYNEKVVLFFKHIYKSEKEILDHDNIEIKTIKDTIAVHLLPDDNPKWCADFMDYEIGEYTHSEIYVIPFRIFKNMI